MNSVFTVILNPTAGEGLSEKRWASFESGLKSRTIHFNLIRTEYRGHAIEIAMDLHRQGATRIGVFGGDGTLNEVVHGLMQNDAKEIELAVFPGGSSCDFEKKLEFSKDWVARLTGTESVAVDVCRVDCHDCEGNPVSRYFINNSSIGIISLANERFNSVSGWTKRLKRWTVDGAAVIAGLAAIREFDGFECSINTDDKEIRNGSSSNLTFFKTPYFGGGMNYGVETDPADGMIYLAAVGFKSRMNLATLIPSLYIGNILKRDGTSLHICNNARVHTDKKMLVETDGEVAGYTPASYTIIKEGIRLVV